jgi:MFS transporter, PHS family, inorganic phosphate transporter
MVFNGVPASDPNSNGLGWIFIIFGFVIALGALFAWVWIPALQGIRDEEEGLKLPNKNLEVLGEGLRQAREDGQVIGFRDKLREAGKPLKARLRKIRRVESVRSDA